MNTTGVPSRVSVAATPLLPVTRRYHLTYRGCTVRAPFTCPAGTAARTHRLPHTRLPHAYPTCRAITFVPLCVVGDRVPVFGSTVTV